MRNHTLTIMGLEVSFKAEADPTRVERAKTLIEERYAKLTSHGGQISKEKLLTFLALSLADDLIALQDDREKTQEHINRLLTGIEEVTANTVL